MRNRRQNYRNKILELSPVQSVGCPLIVLFNEQQVMLARYIEYLFCLTSVDLIPPDSQSLLIDLLNSPVKFYEDIFISYGCMFYSDSLSPCRSSLSPLHKTIAIAVSEAPATDSKNNLETFLFSEIKKDPTL